MLQQGSGIDDPQKPGKRESRLAAIHAHLISLGTATVEELVDLTGVSRMTAHRDLDELEKRGTLHRTRGGASVQKTSFFEASVEYRLLLERRAKNAIAEHATTFVEPGQVLLLDDSTTTHAFLRSLPAELPVTVVTNFLPNLQLAASRPNTHLIALGGDYQPSYQAFFGLLTESALAKIHADLLICSASALRGASLFHQSQLVISTRRAMIASSTTRLLLLDGSKIGQTALYCYGSVEDYDAVILDSGADANALEILAEFDVKMHVVPLAKSEVSQ
jgi:DeoR/GlpR family transcriptional regulator of sugar metabolism